MTHTETIALQINEWAKTKSYIVLDLKDQDPIVIGRKPFEAWVDRTDKRIVSWPNADCESTAEDIKQLTWDEFYKNDFIEMHFAEYLSANGAIKDVLKTVYSLTA